MPTVNNIYNYCADYSGMSDCLFAIQQLYDQGELDSYLELLRLIEEFEQDALKKLYARTFTLYGLVKNIQIDLSFIEGDFTQEYLENDFSVGAFIDRTNTGFSSKFKTVINVFQTLCAEAGITDEQRVYLDEALSEVLELFDELKEYLDAFGFNPCSALPSATIRNNSQFIHVQAAGSTGADGVAAGIHLRWGLDGHLGDNHLPQGAYANAEANPTGYRKADDFVFVYRTPYAERVPINLDFQELRPIINPAKYQWTYIINSSTVRGNIRNRVRLSFINQDSYMNIGSSIDPKTDPFAFLSAYDDFLEIAILEKTFFSASIHFRKGSQHNSASIMLEALGKTKRELEVQEIPVVREALTSTLHEGEPIDIEGENLSKLMLKKNTESHIDSFEFETYHDFLVTREASEWTEVGNGFALSLNDVEVGERLEKSGVYDVDHLWPHYNDGTTVRIANYLDKWSVDRPYDPSLKTAVQEYLELSKTDPRALYTMPAVGDIEAEGLELSYLDILRMLAVDYHFARMLGLGHIDTPTGSDSQKWLYRVSYQNRKGELMSQQQVHEYLSIPTSRQDLRLPKKPTLRPLKYRLGADEEYSREMFDELGYSKTDRTRVVSVGRQLMVEELLDDSFWSTGDGAFNISEQCSPILYGIEYRPDTQPDYVKPEITADDGDDHIYYAYDQTNGQVQECIPVPDNKDSLYTHFELEEGVHHYAAYAINIFSRASEISDEVSTDVTEFPIKNRLFPPTDIGVQYIQEEETLLFTTQTEQDWLANRVALFPNMDTSFTRITFNWLDVIDVSDYPDINQLSLSDITKGKQIKPYFKPSEIFEVRGAITNVKAIQGVDDQVLVEIGGYTVVGGGEQLPTIPSFRFDSFQGSWLSTPSGLFEIVSVNEQNGKIVLLIKKQVLTESSAIENTVDFNKDIQMLAPIYGERFSFTENMAMASQWEDIVNTITLVDLGNPNQPLIETETDEQGNHTHILIGGLSANAIITPLDENSDQLQDLPGYYSVQFGEGTVLHPHPQVNLPYDQSNPANNNPSGIETPHVEWYKGQVRIPYRNNTEQKKLVQVLRIVSLDPLKLVVYDPVDQQDPDAIKISQDGTDHIPVNFHPGYKAYLFTEPSPEKFNSANLKPGVSENDKKILFALQSIDNTFSSRISIPNVFLVKKVVKPVELEEVLVPRLRVRPDQKGRAAFTFDRKIPLENGLPRNPFGFMFFRLSSQEFLEALYAPNTVELILDALDVLEADPYGDQRFYELANLIFDPSNPGHFKVFDALPAPFGFPDPDKLGLVDVGDNQLVRINKFRAAIRAELLPLTEQPPIYTFVREGVNTENTEPVIRDMDGNLLEENDPRFNPFPMVRKFKPVGENEMRIRFTDYTLRGSSRFYYFYTAAEITNQLVIGPLSPFTGPVGILHTAQDIAPNVLGYRQLTAPEIGISFHLGELIGGTGFIKIRVYRSNTRQPLELLANFADYGDVDFEVQDDQSIIVVDRLMGVELLGTLHFRFASVRNIINEFDEIETVVSKPSEIISVNAIDTINPEAPDLAYNHSENKLSWMAELGKGSYYLYQQQPTGNWRQLEAFTDVGPGMISHQFGSNLPSTDEDGNQIYHRFKVRVQNTSGLFNLTEKELTI